MKSKSIGWFLYDRDLCHERVKDLGLGNILKMSKLARISLAPSLPSRNETLTIAVKNQAKTNIRISDPFKFYLIS